jgi:hypothetical protein
MSDKQVLDNDNAVLNALPPIALNPDCNKGIHGCYCKTGGSPTITMSNTTVPLFIAEEQQHGMDEPSSNESLI